MSKIMSKTLQGHRNSVPELKQQQTGISGFYIPLDTFVFKYCLYVGVECSCISSVGSLLHPRGASSHRESSVAKRAIYTWKDAILWLYVRSEGLPDTSTTKSRQISWRVEHTSKQVNK